jgi:tripartite-type tricarboxylate transporter receptor subunit TctC
MNFARREFLQLAGAAAITSVLPHSALGLDYPTRPVRLIVPYAPAGPTDVFARVLARSLSEDLGKQFYVENVPGAGGNIGTGRAAQATPDGYTLLVVGVTYAINPSLYEKVPYDPYKDLEPIIDAVTNTLVLAVNPSVPAQTVRELVALVKASPGKYSYASTGTGTVAHLAGELFRLSLGLDLVHVPFNGAGPAITSTLGGHTPISFTGVTPVVPHALQGKLRALAVTSETRLPVLPDVPTMAEAGYPDIQGENWTVLLAPTGTPTEIIAFLNREIANVLTMPDVRERLTALGYEPVAASTRQACATLIRAEISKWGKVVRDAGIKAE